MTPRSIRTGERIDLFQANIEQTGQVGISDDGQELFIQMDTSEGEARLTMSYRTLQNLLQNLSQLATECRRRTGETNEASVVEPDRFKVDSTIEGSRVTVSFQMNSGLEQHYGLAPSDAANLQAQIGEAVSRCRHSMN